MESLTRTESEYLATISKVLEYVHAHLDDALTPHQLADIAGFSQHHFHRIFRAVAGESVMDHVRRIRLERAAHHLKTSRMSIAGIAFEAGYQAQEAFTRVFQAYFGVVPSTYRKSMATHLLPATSGVHFALDGFSPLQRIVAPAGIAADGLCAAHRNWPGEFEHQWEEVLSAVFGLSEFIYPPFFRNPMEDHMPQASTDIDKEINDIEHEIETAKQRLIEARRRRPREPVSDYVLKDSNGNDVRLSELFGDKDDLILIHNMGTGCSYCTMWADGFTGLAPHLSDRASFVVCSPDKPEVQKRFAEKRNWNFRMVSAHDSSFIKDMGFWQEDGPSPGPWPGVSTFRKDRDGQIYRIAKSHFGPGDDFCAVWPFLDLLEKGANGWEPKYSYDKR